MAFWAMSQERDKGWGSSEDPVGTHSPKGEVEGASMAQTAGDHRKPFPQYLEALYSWTLVAWPGPVGRSLWQVWASSLSRIFRSDPETRLSLGESFREVIPGNGRPVLMEESNRRGQQGGMPPSTPHCGR